MKKIILLLVVTLFGFLYGCEQTNNPDTEQKEPIAFTVETLNLKLTDAATLPLELHDYSLEDIELSIDDDTIAILEGEIILPLKAGQTTVRAVVTKTKQAVSFELIIDPVVPKWVLSRNFLSVGTSLKLGVDVPKNIKEYTITMSDESILSINNALQATALKVGTTVLTITDKSDETLTSSVTIEVIPTIPELTSARNLLEVGSKTALLILSEYETSLDDYEITIDKNDIIDLDDTYVVTALKEGVVTITLTSKTNDKVTTTYEITVDKPSTEVNQLGEPKLGPLFLSTEDLNAVVQAGEVIEVKIAGGKDNYNYRWYSSDGNVLAATDQGKVIGIREGRSTLTVVSKTDPTVRGRINITVVGTPNVDYVSRMVEIALHEATLGYLAGPGKMNKYGDWFEYNGVDWCAIFVSWVGNQAGVGLDVAHKFALVSDGVKWYKNKDAYYDRGTYQPKPGDIIFFHNAKGPSHTGVVISSDENFVYTVEGNTSNGVFKRTYNLEDTYILGYGNPDYPSFTN